MPENNRPDELFMDALLSASPQQHTYQAFTPIHTDSAISARLSPSVANAHEVTTELQPTPRRQTSEKSLSAEHDENRLFDQVQEILRHVALVAEGLESIGSRLSDTARAKSGSRSQVGRRAQRRFGRGGREAALIARLQDHAPWSPMLGEGSGTSRTVRSPTLVSSCGSLREH
ncbi:hypothetical protein EJ04DRAFT_526036 [Polyplosphaeria fusca]|uniref:Uncharacterized protein n=1 Tax=Polyplosphaeria fusca TaxID=682080 RepID=A0A9P4UZW7_9PLEO|nr:hypothetical protein EJ04DRAFT_526036 [Polyplosphaeria fusca]